MNLDYSRLYFIVSLLLVLSVSLIVTDLHNIDASSSENQCENDDFVCGTECSDQDGQKFLITEPVFTVTEMDPNGDLDPSCRVVTINQTNVVQCLELLISNNIDALCTIPPDAGQPLKNLEGTNNADIIIGFNGDDKLIGKDGDDVLQGNNDNDILDGDDGRDFLAGGFGDDQLNGGDNSDVLNAGPNDDYLNGGKDHDELYGGFGSDILEGGSGADYFDCGDGIDVVIDFDPSEGDTHANNCEDIRKRLKN